MKSHLSRVDSLHADFHVLSAIENEILARCGGRNSLHERFPLLVRDAVDFLLDPVRTARTRVVELDNVEKTFIGLKLEHFVRDMLDVPKGLRDLVVDGVDVDIKNTVNKNWSIPQETYRSSEPCLLMAVNDVSYTCSLGIFVAKPAYLHQGKGNRDTKKGISQDGFEHIRWILSETPFPPSRFAGLNMDRFRELRKELDSGNDRAAQFFRENLFRVVHRDVVHALLFDQYDYMKRIRSNGGAPDVLGKENVAILIGTYNKDRNAAAHFGITNLGKDEVVSVKPRNKKEWALLRSQGDVLTDRWDA